MQFNHWTFLTIGFIGILIFFVLIIFRKQVKSVGKNGIVFDKSVKYDIEKLVEISVQILSITHYEIFEEQKKSAVYKGRIIIDRLATTYKELLRAKLKDNTGNITFSYEYKNYSNLLSRLFYSMQEIFSDIFKKNGFVHLEDHEYKERKKMIVQEVSRKATEIFDDYYCSVIIPRDSIEDYNNAFIVEYVEDMVNEMLDEAKEISLNFEERIKELKLEKEKIWDGEK